MIIGEALACAAAVVGLCTLAKSNSGVSNEDYEEGRWNDGSH